MAPLTDAVARRFGVAFETVLSKPSYRFIVVTLTESGRDLRYEELRKAVSASSQQFARDIEMLLRHAIIDRKVVERGDRYDSHLSASRRGRMIGEILISLSHEGTLPSSLNVTEKRYVQLAFSGGSSDDMTVDA